MRPGGLALGGLVPDAKPGGLEIGIPGGLEIGIPGGLEVVSFKGGGATSCRTTALNLQRSTHHQSHYVQESVHAELYVMFAIWLDI